MIRRAVEQDVPAMVVLGAEFHAMAKAHAPYDPESYAAFLREGLKSPHIGLFVIEREHAVVGMVGAVVAPYFFNFNRKTASELFWFVTESARGSRDSIRLFRAIESWAKLQGADSLTMVALGSNPGVASMYERFGYELLESHYVRRL